MTEGLDMNITMTHVISTYVKFHITYYGPQLALPHSEGVGQRGD